MRTVVRQLIVATACALAASGARAQWEGATDLGISIATGNTETVDVDVAVDASLTSRRLIHEFDFTAYRSDRAPHRGGPWTRDQNVVDADYAMRVAVRDSRWYGTVNGDAYHDIGLDWRFAGSAGGGVEMLDSDHFSLTAEAGIGRTLQRDPDTGRAFDETAWRWSLDGQWWLIPERLQFAAGFRGLHISGHGVAYDGEAALRMVVLGPFTAGLRIDSHRETQPVSGREPTDLLARLTLGVVF